MKMAIAILSIIVILGILGVLVSWSGLKNDAQSEQARLAQHDENANSEKHEVEKGSDERGWIERYEKLITLVCTILIAAFTVALAAATFRLWDATKDLVEDAKHNAELQLRAYVFPEYVAVEGISEPKPPTIRIKLQNSGQTPAYHVTHRMRADFRKPDDANYPLTADDPWDSQATFAPRVNVDADQIFKRIITEQDRVAFDAGNLYFCVYGEIRYRDVFGQARWTKYKYVFDKRSGLSDGHMWVAADGNDADSPK